MDTQQEQAAIEYEKEGFKLNKSLCNANDSYFTLVHRTFRSCLGGENGMEWKGMKRIILEYSSIPLFGSFNGGNGKSIPLFESLSGREWNG